MERFAVTGQVARYDPVMKRFVPGNVEISADGEEIFRTTGPTLDAVEEQLVWLRNYADLRFDRNSEINRQLDDIGSFFGAVTRLDGSSRQHTLEFLTATNQVVYALEMRAKWYTWTPRPIDLSSNVHPIIQTPDHSSYPSGHATEAFAMATLLARLMDNEKSAQDGMQEHTMPYRLAHRIAVNRTIAGVHYPIDSAAGAVMGCMIGEAIWSMLKSPTNPVMQLQQEIDWLKNYIEALREKPSERREDKELSARLKDAETRFETASAQIEQQHEQPPQQAYPTWCGTFMATDYPAPKEFDFLLPNSRPNWTENMEKHVTRAPITEAYDAALELEW
ncbi:phosphatase PAP2 family protein [uncultured Tateyamaria sp.]|uniref:phosphatase PAP2 family protein n=1 Tax=uncultured Tateyamaria sp. TaxID=455651 RepID=UPI00262CF3C1|nr:phosphatase PAP2 family protein [uncultured Tateyamaria sp.]